MTPPGECLFSGFGDCFSPVSMDSGLERFEDFELHLFLRAWIVYRRFIPPLHDNTRPFYSPRLFERVWLMLYSVLLYIWFRNDRTKGKCSLGLKYKRSLAVTATLLSSLVPLTVCMS